MTERRRRVCALWRGVFGEPPPVVAEPELLLRLLVAYLPAAPPYGGHGQGPGEPEAPVSPIPACERIAD